MRRIHQKLTAHFYGPFLIIDKIRNVAYKLQLPESSKIHPIFHVSLLKHVVGNHAVEPTLPQGLEMDSLTPSLPEKCLAVREVTKKGEKVPQWLEDKPVSYEAGIDKENDNIEPLDIPAGPGTWKVYKRKKFKKGQMKRAPTFHQHYATTSAPIATASQVGLVYNWSWLRRIRTGLILAELEDLCSLVAHLRLSLNQGIWECTIDDSRTFTVKGMRSHITHLSTNTSLIPIRWNSILPSKVNILTWRIVNLRLPTRVNLDYRGIDLDSIRCPICDAAIETKNHLFTECDLSKSTWNRILEWRGSKT
ncbi:RNA-directed DNA polymerase, eukaryota, reverse transcriptase zinc-binding domain protein [Tanacetum coccineum]